MTISKTIHEQMLTALRAVRQQDLNSYESTLDWRVRQLVCDAIDAGEVNNAELEEVAGTDLGHNQGGRVYAHGYLYIEHYADEWALTIMNDSWTGPLQTLEAILYGYARIEILPRLTGDDEMQALIDEWQTFCKDEGLECVDAGEMLNSMQSVRKYADADRRQLIDARCGYIEDFIHRWDKSQSEGPY